jgi:peptidoglycan/xylan/chitin deacetylase (PgdA/CDA1 family)
MEYLKENYLIIALEQLVNEIKSKTIKRKTVVITIDDGYADNLYNALPILEKLSIPATVFVSSGNINKPFFYWDGEAVGNNRPLTEEELKKLNNSNVINIGGHTLSHPHIPTLSKDQKISEITDDKNKLNIYCNKDIKSFSFPFGEYDAESLTIVKNSGYSCACILNEQRVNRGTDIYRLTRFLVRNWGPDEFIKNLKFKFL